MQKAPARARNKLWDPALRRLLPPVADFGSVRFFARELAAGPPERRVTTTLGYIPELNLDLALRPGETYLYDAVGKLWYLRALDA